MKPKVSVIITTFNRSNLLKRAVNSVLNQNYQNIEIIIVDDASTDNTEEVIKNYQKQHNNIIYIRHKISMGANVGRNNAIKASSAEFIAGLDDDDQFTKDRIDILMRNYNDKYSLVTSKNIIILKNGIEKRQKGKIIVTLYDILYDNYIFNQALIKKERIIAVGMYDENLLACQDYDMWVRLIKQYGDALSLNQYTQIIYTNHGENRISSIGSRKKFVGYFNFYKKFKYLMTREQRKAQLSNIVLATGRTITLKKLMILLNIISYKRLLILYLRSLRSRL